MGLGYRGWLQVPATCVLPGVGKHLAARVYQRMAIQMLATRMAGPRPRRLGNLSLTHVWATGTWMMLPPKKKLPFCPSRSLFSRLSILSVIRTALSLLTHSPSLSLSCYLTLSLPRSLAFALAFSLSSLSPSLSLSDCLSLPAPSGHVVEGRSMLAEYLLRLLHSLLLCQLETRASRYRRSLPLDTGTSFLPPSFIASSAGQNQSSCAHPHTHSSVSSSRKISSFAPPPPHTHTRNACEHPRWIFHMVFFYQMRPRRSARRRA